MIHERSQARRIALQGLYQLDVQGDAFLADGLQDFINQAADDPKIRDFAYAMAKAAWAFRALADEALTRIAPKWPVYRMAVVDRNILRLAAWELLHERNTPPKVILDEAISMGKEFSTADSGSFINGLLDTLLKEHLTQTGRTL